MNPTSNLAHRSQILLGSPVLESVIPVIDRSRDVHTHHEKIVEVANWMAYEELPIPDYVLPLGLGGGEPGETIDFILTTSCIDTAFTDFTNHVKFEVEYGGKKWSDSDALFACMKRALDAGIPLLDGRFLAQIKRSEMEQIFDANIELPMLDEKIEVWRQVGTTLVTKYGGRFRNFVTACSPRLYDSGKGLVERLAAEFPRFNDVSLYEGFTVKFYKLPQLAIWFLYCSLGKSGGFPVEDLDKMTAFADYIVPVALRLHGMISYSRELERAVNTHQMIDRDSSWEIEIRAHCVYATALLAEEINKLREPGRKIFVPQIDARLWTHFHTTPYPHHLTKTIMY